jgi:phage gpG-like protein
MMQVNFQVDVTPVLQALDPQTANALLTKALLQIEQEIVREVVDIFQVQGKPLRWAPLKESTLEKRRKGKARYRGQMVQDGRSVQILVDTGQLRGSIISATHPDSYRQRGRWFVEVGTRRRYAWAHQAGVPERNLPARPFMVVTDDLVQRVISLLQNLGLYSGGQS